MPLDLHMSLSEANESHLWERITAQTTPTRLKALTCTMRIASPFLHMGIFPELRQLTFKHLPVRHHYSNGLHAFVAAISKGAMDGLTGLNMSRNMLRDKGMEMLAEALSKGALRNLKHLTLMVNKIGFVGMDAFCKALSAGALHGLLSLNLADNHGRF